MLKGKTLDIEYTLHDYVTLVLKNYFHKLGDPPAQLYTMVISEVEKALFKSVLEHAHHNQSKAAHFLGVSRGTLRKKLKEYGIDDSGV